MLLLENDDVALMNESIMLEALREAYPGGLPPLIDHVWYADTSLSSDIAFYDFTSALQVMKADVQQSRVTAALDD